MPDPENHRAALIAAACLIGPTIPPALVVNRPHEAVTALTRIADLLEPWLEAVSATALPGTAATATDPGTPKREEAQHDRSERPSP